jgi:hypothetical protein
MLKAEKFGNRDKVYERCRVIHRLSSNDQHLMALSSKNFLACLGQSKFETFILALLKARGPLVRTERRIIDSNTALIDNGVNASSDVELHIHFPINSNLQPRRACTI